MKNYLYLTLNLPTTTYLGVRIYKKQVLDNAELPPADRQTIQQEMDTLEWRHVLKAGTCVVPPFNDGVLDYTELHLIHVVLKSPDPVRRLAEVLQRMIQYPLILVFEYQDQLYIQMADKRINRADSTRLIVEKVYASGWFSEQAADPITSAFLQAFSFTATQQTNLLTLWQSLTDAMTGLETARFSGHYTLSSIPNREQRQHQLEQLHALEQQLASIRAALKRETQFNRRLALNMQAQHCQQQLTSLSAQLD